MGGDDLEAIGPMVLGGNVFGWLADRRMSFRVMDKFVALGGGAIDTADQYSVWQHGGMGGESERLIGAWMQKRRNREKIRVFTKVGLHPRRRGLSVENIRRSVDESLGRLESDYIDLYFAHRDDLSVPQQEYLSAFNDLMADGKIRGYGISEFEPERIASAIAVCEASGLRPFSVSQDRYSLLDRRHELRRRPLLDRLGVLQLAFSPLASGVLTGKYHGDLASAAVDIRRQRDTDRYFRRGVSSDLILEMQRIAAEYSVEPGAVALAWLRAKGSVPVVGMRSVAQMGTLQGFLELDLGATDISLLTRLSLVP